MNKNITCSICCSNYEDIFFLHKKKYGRNNAEVYICRKCGVIFQLPKLEENQVYDENYYYFNKYPASAVISDLEKANFISELIKKYSPQAKTVYDLGAGCGIVLNAISKKRFDVSGLEISKAGVNYAKKYFNITLENRSIEKICKVISSNVIIMTDALEHTSNPALTLKKIYNCILPDSLMIIEVPNIGGLYYKLIKKRWVGFNQYHNFHFTARSISQLAVNAGFKICGSVTTNFNILSSEGIWRLGIKDILKDIFLFFQKNNYHTEFAEKNNSDCVENPNLKIDRISFKKKLLSAINFPSNKIAEFFNWGDQLWIILKK